MDQSSEQFTLPRFGFGKNFKGFLDNQFNEERAAISRRHLLGFLGVADLDGKSMLDIGCGPGMPSLSAYRAKVKRLFSFDYDPNSVASTKRLRAMAGDPPNWQVEQGSAIDTAYMDTLGTFDIVYSWGVLHHTGDQWTGIQNAFNRMAPDGVCYLALYNRDYHKFPSADFWLPVKKAYVTGGWLTKRAIEYAYVVSDILFKIVRLRSPFDHIVNYKVRHGMSYFVGVKDWVGGWPMEYSTVEDVKAFGAKNGLTLEKLNTAWGCAEYLFRKPA